MQTTTETLKTPGRLLNTDDATFRASFNRTAFIVSHQLAGHPLFEFERLFRLLKTDKSKLFWDMGDIKVNQRWNDIKAGSLSVEEAFNQIENADAWMLFRSIQRDPEYKALLEDYLKEVETRSGVDFKRHVKVKDAIIFVTSPRRVSTYHIDRECSFLLQLRGQKNIYIFDRNDREVITEQELERFWTLDNNAAAYKEKYQDRAQNIRLVPGNGVHIPVGAPHWVKNSNEVSISLNINIHFHDYLRGNIYRANHYIRKLGISPKPLGQSPLRDLVKGKFMHGFISARRLLQRRPLPPSPSRYRKTGPPWRQ